MATIASGAHPRVFSDIISEIEGCKPNEGPDIHYESQTETIERITKSLGNFNFDPSKQVAVDDRSEFFSRLVQGDPYLIFKTLEFLVCGNVPNLKKRAYLAKFLLKIDVPADFRSEKDVSELYNVFKNDSFMATSSTFFENARKLHDIFWNF